MAKTKNVATALVALSIAGGALATEYYVKDGTTDWTKASSFTTDAEGTADATAVPGADAENADIVCIPADATVTVDSASSLAVVNRLARIRPMNKGATVVFSVPADTVWTNDCPVNWDGVSHRIDSARYGKFRKAGAGTLEITGKRLSANTSGSYDVSYDTEIFIDGGKLVMPQAPVSGEVIYCQAINLTGENTTLVLPRGRRAYPKLLNGVASSLVTNPVANVSEIMYIIGDGSVQAAFHGRIQGPITLYVAANQVFSNPENTFAALDIFNRKANSDNEGVVTVPSLGTSGEPSPLGAGSTISFGQKGFGAKLLYAGTDDETTDKSFTFYASTKDKPLTVPHTIDAGAHGGLTFTGAFRHGTEDNARDTSNKHVILAGTNARPCVIEGAVSDKTAKDGNVYCLNFEKTGTGVWRFADSLAGNQDRFFTSAFTVREGTLQFDSLARQYDLCSVGLSTNRYLPHVSSAPMTEAERTAYGVPWAFGLGSATTEGTLEYTGTADINGWSRPIGILGNARVKNDTAARVRYLGLASEATAAATLTLDGSNTASNEFADVIDTSAIPISVVKKGVGRWVLGGELAFHGNLDVQDGELIVRKYASQYTWYRINFKSMLDPLEGQKSDGNFNVLRFGLYDANGAWQCQNLATADNFAALEPGQAAVETTRAQSRSDRPLEKMFLALNAANSGYGWYTAFYNLAKSATVNPTVGDPTSHIAVEMRLRATAAAVTSYDVALAYGKNTPAGYHRHPNRWTLEGSVDGLHWETLDDCTMAEGGDTSPYWALGRDKATAANLVTHTNGRAIASASARSWTTLDNVTNVSVAAGATLAAEGCTPTLSHLTVNAATGAGTIRDFALAENGLLDVTNWDKSQTCVPLGLTAAGSTALDNLRNWTLRVDGAATPSRRIVVRDGRAFVVKTGMTLTFK